jgi:hypothetical protein
MNPISFSPLAFLVTWQSGYGFIKVKTRLPTA